MNLPWPSKNGQFLISRGTAPAPSGAKRHRTANLVVDVYGDFHHTYFHDVSGALIGMILGSPVDLDGGPLGDVIDIDALVTADNVDWVVEHYIYRLAGSFLFILDVAFCRRIYLDADGSKSLVYDPQKQVAGATAMTLLDAEEYRERFRADLYRTLGVDKSGWFPAGLTAHAGVHRLICNHYLDLDSWKPKRHWPAQEIQTSDDPAGTFDAILDRMRRMAVGLMQSGNVTVALTAGTDSRFMLSALRSLDVEFVTVAAPAGALDVATARLLAQRFDLSHRVLPYCNATADQAQAWRIRAGHCVTGANMTMHPSVEPLKDSYFLGGLGGEVGRGFLWLRATPDLQVDALTIVNRLKLPRAPELLEAVAAWLEPIMRLDSLVKLDLAYLELRMSSWGFSDAYANPVRRELHPIISRANYEAMLSVPWQMRRDGTAFGDAIARAWPELLTVPINRYGDWRDFAGKLTQAASNPHKVFRKLTQLALAR